MFCRRWDWWHCRSCSFLMLYTAFTSCMVNVVTANCHCQVMENFIATNICLLIKINYPIVYTIKLITINTRSKASISPARCFLVQIRIKTKFSQNSPSAPAAGTVQLSLRMTSQMDKEDVNCMSNGDRNKSVILKHFVTVVSRNIPRQTPTHWIMSWWVRAPAELITNHFRVLILLSVDCILRGREEERETTGLNCFLWWDHWDWHRLLMHFICASIVQQGGARVEGEREEWIIIHQSETPHLLTGWAARSGVGEQEGSLSLSLSLWRRQRLEMTQQH